MIIPLKNFIQIETESVDAGVINLSSLSTAIEYGKVVGVGEGIDNIKVGDNIFFKSWGVDCITHEEKKFYFINLDTNAIVAIIK